MTLGMLYVTVAMGTIAVSAGAAGLAVFVAGLVERAVDGDVISFPDESSIVARPHARCWAGFASAAALLAGGLQSYLAVETELLHASMAVLLAAPVLLVSGWSAGIVWLFLLLRVGRGHPVQTLCSGYLVVASIAWPWVAIAGASALMVSAVTVGAAGDPAAVLYGLGALAAVGITLRLWELP